MFTPGHTPGCISMLFKPSQVSVEVLLQGLVCCLRDQYPLLTNAAEIRKSCCLCARQALFTGDHLMYSAQLDRLSIARYHAMGGAVPISA